MNLDEKMLVNLTDSMFMFIDKDKSGQVSFKEAEPMFKDFGFGDNSRKKLKKTFEK